MIEPQQKIAVDPLSLAAMAAVGKIWGTNALSRHAMNIKPLRRLGQEIAGVGLRTAVQGKPILSRPFREVAAIGLDPSFTRMYEMGHAAGTGAIGNRAPLRELQTSLGKSKHLEGLMPKATQTFLEGIPLESKGLRKVIDYGFTPVGQVANDINSKFLSPLKNSLGLKPAVLKKL